MYIQKLPFSWVMYMNLRAAEKELRGRSPEVALQVLLLETLVVVSASILLVNLFS